MRALSLIVCTALLACTSHAAPILEFYFSRQPGSVHTEPSEYGDPDLLEVEMGEIVYLWVHTPLGATDWRGIAVDFTPDAICGEMELWADPGNIPRWESGSDFDPTDEDINLLRVWGPVGIGQSGTETDDQFSAPSSQAGWWHYCLGSICWFNTSPKWMSVGSGLIVRDGYVTSDVYFGFDETGAPEYAGSGVVAGTTSLRPDIWKVPEPASLLPLGMAALLLRRR